MSTEDENKTGLVPSQSSALSRSGTTSLIRRGTQDLLARDEAEQWYKRGLEFSARERHVEATTCYRKAADQGLALGQYSLGLAYECGLGVPQDDHQKVLWYLRAAERGHTTAQIGLGLAYWYGSGVPQDDNQAAGWIRRAAEQGDPGGQFGLALLYLEGKGVPRDSEQAVLWLRRAVEQGDEPARAALAELRMVEMSGPSSSKPTSESDPRHAKLSDEGWKEVLNDRKAWMEQGLMNPVLKPSFLGIDPDWFVYSERSFQGNPLPEFCSISRNILDCFAVALLSIPDLDLATSPLVLRCRLGEGRKKLTLYLIAMLAVGEQMIPLELKEESEVWIASKLRPLASVKEIALGSTYWDRTGRHSFFFFDYPGKMVRDRVPGLGSPEGDGKPRWPECELHLDSVTSALRETAKRAIDLVESTTESSIQ